MPFLRSILTPTPHLHIPPPLAHNFCLAYTNLTNRPIYHHLPPTFSVLIGTLEPWRWKWHSPLKCQTNFNPLTRRHIPEELNHQQYCCGNLNPRKWFLLQHTHYLLVCISYCAWSLCQINILSKPTTSIIPSTVNNL